MQDDWISGTASGSYHASASGLDAAELFASATGILHLEARNGLIPHIELSNLPPLRLRHFEGDLILRHKELNFENAKLDIANGVYQLSGTASLDRALDLKMLRGRSRGFNITGTVRTPIVSIAITPETQAALKR